MGRITLLKGDCLDLLKTIPDNSIDLILTDPPYGTTACKWDSIIPFEPMWKELKRIRKDNAAIVLFGSEPFSSLLRISSIDEYRYDWVWNKKKAANFAQSKFQPMKYHEMISVFYKKKSQFNRIKTDGTLVKRTSSKFNNADRIDAGLFAAVKYSDDYEPDKRLPKSILEFSKPSGKYLHPTQKPVPLLEYLIKTYTNEGDTVLDFTMGSGSTGVACKNLNRKFIGIELDEKYFEIAKHRIFG